MSYDLTEQDSTKLVHKQSLKSAKKLTLKETSYSNKPMKNSTYILADISGSMHGEKMDALKKALHDVWRPGIHGIAFSTEIYDFDSKDIDSLRSMGSTNMRDALQAAWDDSAQHIILLTDGQPDQSEGEILNLVRQHRTIPIDTIGIGSERWAYNADFLREISEITGGRFNSVDEPLMLSEVMSELLQISENAQSTSGAIAL
jgi:Mg-chelatase subunit ChlD